MVVFYFLFIRFLKNILEFIQIEYQLTNNDLN